MKMFIILSSLLLLAGCQTTGQVQSLLPVCTALGAPIEYNSKNKDSDWHAGPKLAPRLAKQNRVGVNLACKAYR